MTPPIPLDMPFLSQNKESLPPPKCQLDLMDDVPVLPVGAGSGRWAMGWFTTVCPMTPTPCTGCRDGLPLFKFFEL